MPKRKLTKKSTSINTIISELSKIIDNSEKDFNSLKTNLQNFIDEIGPRKTYSVRVWEYRSTYIYVKAKNVDEASQLAQDKYYGGEVKFTGNDIGDCGIDTPELESRV